MTDETNLAAVALAAAAQTGGNGGDPAAPPAPAASPAAAEAPAAAPTPADQPAASTSSLTAAAALELAALALPGARADLSALAAEAGKAGASVNTFRTACLKLTPQAETLQTSQVDTGVKKPGESKAAAVPSPGSVYADRAATMQG
ncbi:hypothetical protein [Brevundimonas diminuta]|uniref:hypothetical protein n=1 Tax=Brevundimonas diminuta TaxID=293 RepID=UPI003F7F7C91